MTHLDFWYLHFRDNAEPVFMTVLFEYVPLMPQKNDCSYNALSQD